MKIDEVISYEKLCSKRSDAFVGYTTEEHEQLAEWLEELKIYKECNISKANFSMGYNKAIDEVIMHLDAEIESSAKFIREYDDSIAQKAYYSGLCYAKKIAEQLKEGDSE